MCYMYITGNKKVTSVCVCVCVCACVHACARVCVYNV